jgi:exosortase B
VITTESGTAQTQQMPLDRLSLIALLTGLVALYAPTFWSWSQGTWGVETQGHELLILGISLWLLWRSSAAFLALPTSAASWGARCVLGLGLLLYLVGRTQGVVRLELLSLILMLAGLVLRFKGQAGLRIAWFPLLFLLFAMPLPFSWVLTLTGPLKTAVSALAVQWLSWLGYSVGRSGVVITIGQYQLLVTEACAGLQTMFTLEAMGLLYTHLVQSGSSLRNTLLAVLVVPISFLANVVRVMVLALITHHWGDAAGQGFLHGFAGVVLFAVGLALIALVDSGLGVLIKTDLKLRHPTQD